MSSGRVWNKPCKGGCGVIVSGSRTGYCRACYTSRLNGKRSYNIPCRTGCGRILKETRNGICRACFLRVLNSPLADPEIKTRRIAGLRRALSDPAKFEERSERAKRAAETRCNNPQYLAGLMARLREAQPLSLTPENLAKRDYRKIGKSISATKLSWCPPEWRARYRYLTKSRNKLAAEARSIVEQEMAEAEAQKADADALKHVDSALDHLRHFAPVQVLEHGYRYGIVILRPSEVIARATLRGWQPDQFA